MRRLIYFVLAFVVWVLVAWPFVDGGIDLQVVVAGVHVLAPGQKVTLYQASTSTDTTSAAQTLPGNAAQLNAAPAQ